MNRPRIAVLGATGYTGAELTALLLRHPDLSLGRLTSTTSVGELVVDQYPSLHGLADGLRYTEPDLDALAAESDLAFLALPHAQAMQSALGLLERGVRVIDLSADFRLDDPQVYEEYYGLEHLAPDWLKERVYGLTELVRPQLTQARLVANPGCYPSCCILGLAPLLQNRLIGPRIIVDAKSGLSGAGKKLSARTHYVEANENCLAYAVGTHRHNPEIEQELSRLAQEPVDLSFTPHLVPMSRGMLCSMYVDLQPGVDAARVESAFEDFCAAEPFVHFLGLDRFPETRNVRGSNACQIGCRVEAERGRALVVSAIDNLMKGASSQAIHNMNIMLGLDESAGLQGVLQVL